MADRKTFSRNRVPGPKNINFNGRGGKGGKRNNGQMFQRFRNIVSNMFANGPLIRQKQRRLIKT